MDENTAASTRQSELALEQFHLSSTFNRLLEIDDTTNEYFVLISGSEAPLSATGIYMTATLLHAYAPAFVDSGNVTEESIDNESGLRELFDRHMAAVNSLIDDAIGNIAKDSELQGENHPHYLSALRRSSELIRAVTASGGVDQMPCPLDHTAMELRMMDRWDNDTSMVRAFFVTELSLVLDLYRAVNEELHTRFEERREFEAVIDRLR